MTPEEISTVLTVIAENRETSLQNGLRTRETLLEQMRSGVTPKHYRLDWLRTTALSCIEHAAEASKVFNAKYPGDQISNKDLLDVFMTAANLIVKYSGGGELIVTIKK